MATYCISDLHGRDDLFREFFVKVNFDFNKDELYILGDITDHGPGSVEILKSCISHSDCIHVIMGNHEQMFLEYLPKLMPYLKSKNMNADQIMAEFESLRQGSDHINNEIFSWMKRSGGVSLIEELLCLNDEELEQIIKFIKSLENYKIIDIKGKIFHLSHTSREDDLYFTMGLNIKLQGLKTYVRRLL